MEKNKNIELRSEEFREILEAPSPWILRWGILLLTIFVCLLIACSALIQYPDTISGTIFIEKRGNNYIGRMEASSVRDIRKGQRVNVIFSEYPRDRYGQVQGLVDEVLKTPYAYKDGIPCYIVKVSFPKGMQTSFGHFIVYTKGLEGHAVVLTKEVSLLTRFLILISDVGPVR